MTVQNIVALVNLERSIILWISLGNCSGSYMLPCTVLTAFFRMADPKVVILTFASGKMVCTGGKTASDVYRVVNSLHVLLEVKKLMIYD